MDLEKYSSAITLSDMEIFVFPDLMYGLVLANIMSPAIWKWRERDCFKKVEGKMPYRKLMRLKQFIMDEYEFNLDLNTWGLIHKDKELKRFAPYLSKEEIEDANALFGYTGDKYYFDLDIRRHFGLDKYNCDIIPYWKTETVEAMDAFKYKKRYKTGAGECVSLAALYVAAAFIVCNIALEDMYMILTPLHSQNFLDLNGGVITNNRRIVTKNMWFNGSEISMKAQRALKNEKVTIVSHISGYIHQLYEEATINRKRYDLFVNKLKTYLFEEISLSQVANFLRFKGGYQKYFQICKDCHGAPGFLKSEILFHYEHGSKFRVNDNTREKLLDEVSPEDFSLYPYEGRIRCDELDDFLNKNSIGIRDKKSMARFIEFLNPVIPSAEKFIDELSDFLITCPKLPSADKKYHNLDKISVSTHMQRDEIISYLNTKRSENEMVDLAFYVYRDMSMCDWAPFLKAAMERNPVSIEIAKGKTQDDIYNRLMDMDNVSIYDGKRCVQPDEVVNYNRGDGVEKAVTLANLLYNLFSAENIIIDIKKENVFLKYHGGEYNFFSNKGLECKLHIALPVKTV
ncbi:hypothetical protein J7L67_01245 [bacterium]|nr:hypothetical protein [bacterium]